MSSSPLRSLTGHTLLLLFASAPLVTQEYDLSQRSCVGDDVCLTSFHWCAANDGGEDDQTGCSFPEAAYPRTLIDYQLNSALLTRGRNYIISWKEGGTPNENPVTITCNFGSGYGGPEWETSRNTASKVVTGPSSSFMFNPSAILGQFPTKIAPYIDPSLASWLVAQDSNNHIIISRPRGAISSDGQFVLEDKSQFFILLPAEVESFLVAQKEVGGNEMYEKWKLGGGVGVGVGLPLLMGASAFLGWLTGRRATTRGLRRINSASK